MPKATEAIDQEHDEFYDDAISDDDYGFIFDSDGNLKSVFLPDDVLEVPETIQMILDIFGIDDIAQLEHGHSKTIH